MLVQRKPSTCMKPVYTAAKLAAETTLLPPFSRYSHSMVPGGFEVTS